MWVSKTIQVESCGLLSLSFVISNYRSIFVDVNTTSFFVEIPVKISNPKGRILQIWIPRVCDRYTTLCEIRWRSQGILKEIHKFSKSDKSPLNRKMMKKIEKVEKHK